MNEIPQNLDESMWQIADEGSGRAIEQFGQRYPQYQAELEKRCQMVASLRVSKPARAASVPPYKFAHEVRSPQKAWRVSFASIALGFAAVACATYVTVRLVAPVQPVQSSGTSVGMPAQPSTTGPQVPPSSMAPMRVPSGPNGMAPTPYSPPRSSAHWTQPKPNTEKPISINVERGLLMDVLTAVGKAAGVQISVADGIPEIEIVAHYDNMSPMDILRDMGRTYGFTPFDQDGTEILIIPAVDPRTQEPASGDTKPLEPKIDG